MGYNVAFRYTRRAGGYHGIIVWSSFANEEDFEAKYTPEMREKEEVVEKGITEERAVELVYQTPLACRLSAAFEEATIGGQLSIERFEAECKKALFAERNAQEFEAKNALFASRPAD